MRIFEPRFATPAKMPMATTAVFFEFFTTSHMTFIAVAGAAMMSLSEGRQQSAGDRNHTPEGMFIGFRSTFRGAVSDFQRLSAFAALAKGGRRTNLPRPGRGSEFCP